MEQQNQEDDSQTTSLTKIKQKRTYTRTPAREEAIKRMMEGKLKKDELSKANKILKAQAVVDKYNPKPEPKKEETKVEEKEEDVESQLDEEEIPAPPKKVKKIIKKYVPPPVEESESEEEVIIVKKKPQKKKKIVYVEESDEEVPIVKTRETKSQQNAKSKTSAISVGGVPKQSREDVLSLFC